MRQVFLTTAVCCFLAGGVSADFNWNVESGVWSDGANWYNTVTGTTGTKPDGTANVNLQFSAASVCTLNTDEGLFTNRLVIRDGQTWNIENGGRVGFAWSRIGRASPATINMSGNGAFVLNNDDLYIGFETNGNCMWTMSDTSSITVEPATTGGDNLYIAQDDSAGTLKLVGSQVTVHANEVVIGYVKAANTSPVATLEYVMDAGGASTVVSDVATSIITGTPGASAAAHLVLSAPGVTLAETDIVLIECLGTAAIGGRGVFDTMNGGSAAEGTLIFLGGNVYALTYKHNADGVANLNDIALIFVRSAKHMASNPVPADGSTVNSIPSTLSWTNPDPNDGSSPITCTVYFGKDPNRPQMDYVTLDEDLATVSLTSGNFPNFEPIEDNTTYHWVVDCADPSADPEDGKGMFWKFSTDYNDAPIVDAGPDQVAWLGMSGTAGREVINLDGTTSDPDGLPDPPGAYTVEWTQTGGPATVVINPNNVDDTTVTITVAGVYEFTLTADDTDKQTSDTVEIIVGTDSCEASILSGSYYNSKDFDHDCDVDLVDFADFVDDWLACTNTQEACY